MRDLKLKEIAEESKASQDSFEMEQLLRVIQQVLPEKSKGIIVEIGVDGGGGLATYREAFPKALVIGIDNNLDKKEALKNQNMIFGNSRDPATKQMLKDLLGDELIDFLFIDGDHVYEGVKADWENFKDLVRPGGAIGFHDTSRMGEGWLSKVEVRKFLEEIWLHDTYKCAEFWNGRNNPGIAVVFV